MGVGGSLKGWREVSGTANLEYLHRYIKRSSSFADGVELQVATHRMPEHGDLGERRDRIPKQLQRLCVEPRQVKEDTSDVASRMCEAGCPPICDWIELEVHGHDGNALRSCACGPYGWWADSADGQNALSNQVHGHRWQLLNLFIGEPDNDFRICGLSEARCAEAFAKCYNSVADEGRLSGMEKTDPPVSGLLSVRRRPCPSGPSYQSDEIAASHIRTLVTCAIACIVTGSHHPVNNKHQVSRLPR